MELILLQDVAHLGSLGDEVQVKDGYARNYLLPKGLAIQVGNRNSGMIGHQKKQLERHRQEAIEKAQAESGTVAALELQIQVRAGANGRLFGSVTNRDIQALLAELGYTLDRRSIQLHAPIRSLGMHTATVKLHSDVKVEIQVQVKPSGELVPEPLEGEEGAATENAEGAEGAETVPTGEGEEGAVEAAAEEPTAPGEVESTTEVGAEAAETSVEAAAEVAPESDDPPAS